VQRDLVAGGNQDRLDNRAQENFLAQWLDLFGGGFGPRLEAGVMACQGRMRIDTHGEMMDAGEGAQLAQGVSSGVAGHDHAAILVKNTFALPRCFCL